MCGQYSLSPGLKSDILSGKTGHTGRNLPLHRISCSLRTEPENARNHPPVTVTLDYITLSEGKKQGFSLNFFKNLRKPFSIFRSPPIPRRNPDLFLLAQPHVCEKRPWPAHRRRQRIPPAASAPIRALFRRPTAEAPPFPPSSSPSPAPSRPTERRSDPRPG